MLRLRSVPNAHYSRFSVRMAAGKFLLLTDFKRMQTGAEQTNSTLDDELSYVEDYSLLDDLIDNDISTTVKGFPANLVPAAVTAAKKLLAGRRVNRYARAAELGVSEVVITSRCKPCPQESAACRALGRAIPLSVCMPERDVQDKIGEVEIPPIGRALRKRRMVAL